MTTRSDGAGRNRSARALTSSATASASTELNASSSASRRASRVADAEDEVTVSIASAPNANVAGVGVAGAPPPKDPNADMSNSGTAVDAGADIFAADAFFGSSFALSKTFASENARKQSASPVSKYFAIARTHRRARSTRPRFIQSVSVVG